MERRTIKNPRSGHSARAIPPGLPEADISAARFNRVWTVPNMLSFLRILLVPVFAWLLVGPGEYGWALALLAFSSVTDWVDGKIARMFNLQTKLGQYLDPAADRLLVLVTPIVFVVVGILPLWAAVALVLRDVLLAPTLLIYRRRNLDSHVMYLGKAATFALLWAFPLYLAARAGWSFSGWFEPWAQALMWWGIALYLWTGVLYIWKALLVQRRIPAA
ncbi:CDP-alcohol phosphatidyltransferase family protein [Corynebacterium ulceribovis]|uniref:CDP-alcohol phosphatidyltransferase family protein n=1 Tax=Corynebacterium ulceribovis TaxID=487732 RepID=UPI000361B0E1|nr:CDP-alcohol phosphatidyltransferase family protein [Corynebacterium ulceribovis]